MQRKKRSHLENIREKFPPAKNIGEKFPPPQGDTESLLEEAPSQ